MAMLNYNKRLANINNRKFDAGLNESVSSKLFSSRVLPENIKYLVESMSAIGPKYNSRTIEAADRVKNHLEKGLDLHFTRAYRNQGSVVTKTNIKTHSDFDLLAVVNKYFYPAPAVPNPYPYTDSDPNSDIKLLRSQSLSILKSVYDEVDDSGEKCICIFNKDLHRYVDVVFAFWYNTEEYEKNNNEHYRGVKLTHSHATPDFPFAHANNVNYKGDSTEDGSRRAIRLLKNLAADSDTEIKLLRGFHFTTVVHDIANELIRYNKINDIAIAMAVSSQLDRIINEAVYRVLLKSPNGTEYPLTKDGMVDEFILIKKDLDTLIADSSNEYTTSNTIRNTILFS
jgi:hypothetical protein